MMTQGSQSCWFLAQFKPNSDQIALRNLNRQGFETFLPRIEETKRRGSAFTTVTKPLFPGYIFVAFAPDEGRWRAINSTTGITRLVSTSSEPIAVPDEIVFALKQRCDDEGKLLPAAAHAPGDKLRVTKGPFTEFVATVETIAPDQRIWVLLEIMGRDVRVALSPDAVQRT